MSAVRIDVDAIPRELRELDQWVLWRHEARDGRTTKVPYRADGRGKASSIDAATWVGFDEALAEADMLAMDGVGFVFTVDDPFTGVDLDGFVEGERQRIVELLSSYTERSVSGGLHVIVAGRLNGGGGRHPHDFGVFDRGRYFVVTGAHVDGTPRRIEQRQAELDEFLARYLPPSEPARAPLPPQPVPIDDRELLELAFTAKNGPGMRALYEGRWEDRYASQSEADLGLCRRLAFWTGRDAERIDRLFRSSGLMREKWERVDYRERTIAKAIEGTSDVYRPSSTTSPLTSPRPRPQVTSPLAPSSSRGGEVAHLAPDVAQTSPSWVPIDIVARAAAPPAPPELVGLFYVGLNHLLSGDSEALKTWLALVATAVELNEGRGTVWVDGDDVGSGALHERLHSLGVADDVIARLFAYVLPDEPLVDKTADHRAQLLDVVRELDCRLVVLDGFNALLVLHALSPNEGVDVETFYRLIDPLRKAPAAVLLTDNVVKAKEARGSWAIGSERKKSKAEVHLGMTTVKALVRGGTGKSRIVVHKDRPGHLQRPSPGTLVVSSDGESCSWELEPDRSRDAEGEFRPTNLMESVSRYLELRPDPVPRGQIEEGVEGKTDYVRLAIDRLVQEGYAVESEGPRGARLFSSERPFREEDE